MYKFVCALGGLIAASAPMSAQKPSGADAAALIEMSRQRSLEYARSLPDFVCTEIISRYRLGTTVRGTQAPVPIDRLTVKLSYSQQQESHQLTLVNGMPTSQTFDSLHTGVKSTGEFGGILKSIFHPASQTKFRWESWKTVRRRPVGVYSYEVEENHSNYYLEAGTPGNVRRAIVGFHGTLEIDRDTGEVLHLRHVADHNPLEMGMSQAVTEVDYDAVEVAGNSYLLPVHSQTQLDGKTGSLTNECDFRDYRKFDASSTVDYGPAK